MHFSKDDLDTFHAVYERDIDVALVLALRVSAEVRRLFAASVGRTETELASVRGSKSTDDGREADVELALRSNADLVCIEIENKLGADFQERQIDDYVLRAKRAVECGSWHAAYAVLIAPRSYIEAHEYDAKLFSGRVEYEAVRDVLLRESEWGRGLALLFEHAILQHRRGGRGGPDDPLRTAFFRALALLAARGGLPAVNVRGRKPGTGPMWFPRDGTLTPVNGWTLANGSQGAWLCSWPEAGGVGIELTGVRPLVDEEALVRAVRALSIDCEVTRATVRLRWAAPKLDSSAAFDHQLAEAGVVIEKLVTVRAWWEAIGRGLIERHLLAR